MPPLSESILRRWQRKLDAHLELLEMRCPLIWAARNCPTQFDLQGSHLEVSPQGCTSLGVNKLPLIDKFGELAYLYARLSGRYGSPGS